jgi:D-serine deaminase-like pyridoxal phosphate-dependent protein
VSSAVAPPAVAASLADRLADLARLHADGILTDDGFAAAKRHLLEA